MGSCFRIRSEVCLLVIYAALVICLVVLPSMAEPARTGFLPSSEGHKKRVIWGFAVVSKSVAGGGHRSDPDNHGHHH
ncbi:hypothetical protein LINGRAHAP2_LOCUS8460 [Linum grandiflorum]